MNSILFCTAPQKEATFEHMNSSPIPSYLKDLSWRDERPPIEYSRVGCAIFNAMSEVAEDNQIVQPLVYHEYCDDYSPKVCSAPIYPQAQADRYLWSQGVRVGRRLIRIMQTGDHEHYRSTKYEVWRPRPCTHSWADSKRVCLRANEVNISGGPVRMYVERECQ
jgi:hypothetical protein